MSSWNQASSFGISVSGSINTRLRFFLSSNDVSLACPGELEPPFKLELEFKPGKLGPRPTPPPLDNSLLPENPDSGDIVPWFAEGEGKGSEGGDVTGGANRCEWVG